MKFLFFFILTLTSCARAPLVNTENAMRPIARKIRLADSLSAESFFTTLKKHIDVMKGSRQVSDPMIFGPKSIPKQKYIESLSEILEHQENWLSWIEENFDLFEVYGRNSWGEIMATGYYEPHVFGSRKKTAQYGRALYSAPSDLPTNKEKLYYSRTEIDSENKLIGAKLELAWVSPIDAFFIQIQGSGLIQFEDGETIRVGYDGQNGHKYEALGKHLLDVIPKEKMSMQKIRNCL